MTSTEKRSAHNHFTLHPIEDITLQLSSNFDSGNLQSATLISISNINAQQPPVIKVELTPAAQPFNPLYSTKQSTKAFFHFNIKANVNITLHACIKRMGILSVIEGSFDEYYNICVGSKRYSYQPPEYVKYRPEYMELVKNGEEYSLQFKYNIQKNHKVYFAYHFPYSYQKLCHLLQDLDQSFKHSQQHNQNTQLISGIRGIGLGDHNNIYYRNQLLIQSVEGRQVNLLTITEISPSIKKSGLINLPRQPRISKTLFPYFDIEDRPFHFNKPYIMITSRVHPGETSASYALQGFIKKLIGSSAEAEFLRKTFVFIIIPMINPDGVFNGTYRMDMLGHNLNRFYNSSAPHKQPAIFAITSLLQHHSEDLVAFFDIHSHPQAKGSFAYGNAYTSIEDQIQSQVFAKLLSLNCQSFSYQNCTFSQKNMNSKDINDILTKDGSSRVCAYKKMLSANICNGVHCYALQLGYHGCPIKKDINKNEQVYQFKSQFRRTQKQFDIIDYLEFGTDLVNTIAQIYIQTYRPFMNIPDSNIIINENNYNINSNGTPIQELASPLQNLRQQIAKQVYDKDERFRIMDGGLLKRIKNIQNYIYVNLYSKISKKYPLILENIKQYDKKKPQIVTKPNKPLDQSTNIKAVHSLQLNNVSHEADNKKVFDYNEEYLKRLRQRMPHKDFKNLIFKSNREKIHVVPVQFQIPTSVRSGVESKTSRRISFNKIMDMQAQSLPRIQKKKLNFLTERQRIRQKRIQSSINSQHNHQFLHQPIVFPISRGGLQRKYLNYQNQKRTIQSNIENIIEFENVMNHEDDQEYQKIFMQAAQEYNSNFNPQFNSNLNKVRNEAMFQRQSEREHTKIINMNHQNHTERITRRIETNQQRKRSKSKQKSHNVVMHSQNIAFNVKNLPKVHGKTQKIRNKFDLELKMKQKYDKQYRLDDRLGIEGKDK